MRLLRLVDEPAGWHTERACLGTDIRLWFGPGEGEADEPRAERDKREGIAKTYCAECPFTAYCLELELAFPAYHQHGVRGGLTADERRAALRQRRAAERRAA
ncbi:MAG: WhiB family transcriptional regulator [Actinophytocola sp.]|nr:WhiB family transcriptional regulator [Actinophytocola sp.]